LTDGFSADHGAGAIPPWPALAAVTSAAISGGSASAAASPGATSRCDGSTSQPSWSPSEYASPRATWRQLSIAPVGHGAMHALQPLQTAKSTT